jgi:hypothetical protein
VLICRVEFSHSPCWSLRILTNFGSHKTRTQFRTWFILNLRASNCDYVRKEGSGSGASNRTLLDEAVRNRITLSGPLRRHRSAVHVFNPWIMVWTTTRPTDIRAVAQFPSGLRHG